MQQKHGPTIFRPLLRPVLLSLGVAGLGMGCLMAAVLGVLGWALPVYEADRLASVLDPAEGGASVGEVAADFRLDDLNGQPHRLSDYRGRPVVLNFWATWCAPCVVEMPDLAAAQRAHAVEGLVVLAINQQEGPATVRGFLNRHQLDLLVLLDAHGTVGTRYRVRALPTSLFLDRSGVIRHRFNGALGPRTLSDRLQTILE